MPFQPWNVHGAIAGDCGWSNVPVITINNASLADLAYGDSTFCEGELAPLPTNSMGVGNYVDLNSGGPLQNMVSNPSSGLLTFHSGILNGLPSVTHQIRFTSTGPCPSTDVTSITLKATQTDSLTYPGSPYCKNTALVPAPNHIATGVSGTYTVSPSPLTGFNTTDGSVAITTPTAAGQYSVTFTPTANSCATATTDQFEIINLDSAIFTYAPVYCNGDAIGGYPTSVTSLPLAGGYFADVLSSGGLIVDSLTGKINLTTGVTLGLHTIGYYPTNAGCSDTVYATFTIRDPIDPSFIPATVTYCANSGIDTLTSANPGSYFSPSGNIIFSDSLLGYIDTDASTSGGPYLIYHTNNDGACPDTAQGHIMLTPRVLPIVSYGGLLFCENDPTPGIPTFLAGATGGTFFAAPVGPDSLMIDSLTGVITFDQSDPGTYDIIYYTPTGFGTCPASDTIFGLKIAVAPDPTFDFPEDSICLNTGLHIPPATPSSGGEFDIWRLTYPNGNSIPTGMIGDTLNAAVVPAGALYRIVRTSTKGTCVDSFVDYVSVLTWDVATFSYIPDTFCGVDQNPIPSFFGNTGGTFSNGDTNSLVFSVPAVGMVDLLLSSPGDHLIRYVTGGFCPDTATAPLYIRDALNPSFEYNRYIFCETTTDTLFPQYTLFQPTLGQVTFTSTPPNSALDDTTGVFPLDTVSPGSYLVTMALVNPQQACLVSDTHRVSIFAQNSDPLARLSYGDGAYCINEDTASPVLIANPRDGLFYSTPNYLAWEDRPNGIVDVDHSPPHEYQIRYERQNACKDTLIDTITISVPSDPVVTFHYSATDTVPRTNFCKSDSVPPFVKWEPHKTGTFVAINLGDTTKHMVFSNDSLGTIDLNLTPAGFYEITFIEDNGCNGAGKQRIFINQGPFIELFLQKSDTFCFGDEIKVNVSGGTDYDIFVDGVIKKSDTAWSTTALIDGQIVSTHVRDDGGCISIDSVRVKVYPVPTGIVVGSPGTISGATPIHFDMGTTAPNTYFVWLAAAGGSVTIPKTIDSTTITNPGQTVPIDLNQSLGSDVTPGIVTFSLVPKAEICKGDTQIVRVFINPNDSAIFVPEVFTPNTDDDVNATWLIQWRDDIIKEDYEIFIYNRSGGQVDKIDGLTNRWNGNGLPDGVYWYLIKHKLSAYFLKGAVTIRRK